MALPEWIPPCVREWLEAIGVSPLLGGQSHSQQRRDDIVGLAEADPHAGELTNEMAMKAFGHSRVLEHPEETELHLEAGVLYDTILATDQSHILDWMEEKEEQDEKTQTRARGLSAYVAKKLPAGKTKGDGKNKVKWQSVAVTNAKELEAWLRKNGPSEESLHADLSNGRMFLTYPEPALVRKSISWTQRGFPGTARLALEWWWNRHSLATGHSNSLMLEGF